jgi:hypothetical protein
LPEERTLHGVLIHQELCGVTPAQLSELKRSYAFDEEDMTVQSKHVHIAKTKNTISQSDLGTLHALLLPAPLGGDAFLQGSGGGRHALPEDVDIQDFGFERAFVGLDVNPL